MVAISRCKVRSVACPQMRWLTSTTGAMRALSKAGNRAHGELTVRGGEQELVGFVAVAVAILETQSQVEACALQQVARTARMARRATANADGVLALRLQVEKRIEGGDAVDARKRHFRFGRDVAQRLQGKVFVAVSFLSGFEDAKQRPGASPATGDHFVDENLLCGRETSMRGCLHRHSSRTNCSFL